MRRRDFIRRLAGLAAAPTAAAVAATSRKPKRSVAMAENFRRTYGPSGWGKTLLAYSKQDAARSLKMWKRIQRDGHFKLVGRVHDSFTFKLLTTKGAH